MLKAPKKKLISQCTIEEFGEVLLTGNGFGQDMVWIKKFFKEAKYTTIEEYITPYEHNIAQVTMTDYFEKTLGFTKTDEVFLDETGECAVTYENIEVSPDKYTRGYKNAYVCYEKNKDRMLVMVNRCNVREIVYRLYCNETEQLTQSTLLQKWLEYAKKNNFYRGQKIDAACNFVKVANANWEDIILPKKVVEVVRNQVDELFRYREILEANGIMLKRGIILQGGAGNGKSLLCKVLAKEAEATVVFAMPNHLADATEVRRVCKMVKDLAPCLLIIEDIDWIAQDRSDSADAGRVIEFMNHLDGVEELKTWKKLSPPCSNEKKLALLILKIKLLPLTA